MRITGRERERETCKEQTGRKGIETERERERVRDIPLEIVIFLTGAAARLYLSSVSILLTEKKYQVKP